MARLLGKSIEGAMALYQRDLRLAFEQDAVAPISGQRMMYGCYFPFWHFWCGGGETAACPTRDPVAGGDSTSDGGLSLDGGNATTAFDRCGYGN